MKVGDIFESSNDGKFEIIEYLKYKKIKIKFLNTGYETWTTGIRVTDGSIKDKLKPTVCGVGYVGDGEYTTGTGGKRGSHPFYIVWVGMIKRCYDINVVNHKHYKDCTVCDEWLNYQNFAKWYETNLPKDADKVTYQVDKDIIKEGNKIYCPEFCQIVTAKENNAFALNKRNIQFKKVKVVSPEGDKIVFYNVSKFTREYGVSDSTIRRAIKNKSKCFAGGWEIVYVKEVSMEEFVANS